MVDGGTPTPPTPAHLSPMRRVQGLGIAEHQQNAPATSDPPRLAKEGYEWVWFPEGYWAEREIRGMPGDAPRTRSENKLWRWTHRASKSKSSSEEYRAMAHSPKTISTPTPPGHGSSPVPFPPSPYMSEEAHVQSLQHPTLRHQRSSQGAPERIEREWPEIPVSLASVVPQGGLQDDVVKTEPSPSVTSIPGKGLLSVARRGLRAAFHRSKAKAVYTHDNPSRTNVTLQAVQSYFTQVPLRRNGTQLEAKGVTERGKRRIFGKAPWHRKDSSKSDSSAGSSVREILKGRSPPTTPTARHRSLETTDARPPTPLVTSYPGGEAARMTTPPLKDDTAGAKPRGMFFDIGANPNLSDVSSSESSPEAMPRAIQRRRGSPSAPKSKEWWENQRECSQNEGKPPSYFDFDIPEHLPNSPLCPAHPLHKGGGNGVCVYHGRNRTSNISEEGKEDGKEKGVMVNGIAAGSTWLR